MMNSGGGCGSIRLIFHCLKSCNTLNIIKVQRNHLNVPSISATGLFPSRSFSSKTPISKSNVETATKRTDHSPGAYPYEIPTSKQIKLVSADKDKSPATQPIPKNRVRKRKEILRMQDSELEGYAIMQKRPPLIDRRGEATNQYLRAWSPEEKNYTDLFSYMHGDWNFKPQAVKRWIKTAEAESEILTQAYNPKRNTVLGNDLAAAHFIVFRKGKVRFRDHTEWISEYRKDAKPGVNEEDLPVMSFNLCTLPVNYDPRYRVEAIDFTGLPIRYEGLQNFQSLNYVKWLSFKDTPHIDDWCLGRIARIFNETLEYIDLSGCTALTDKGIGALARCRNLKTLVLENLPHVKYLEIVAAMLEDQIPELTVLGVDYEARRQKLIEEGEELERKAQADAEALEANTITVEALPGPDPFLRVVDRENKIQAS